MRVSKCTMIVGLCLLTGVAFAVKGSVESGFPGVDTAGNLNFVDADNGDQDISGFGATKIKVNEKNGKAKLKGRGEVINNSGEKFKSTGNDAEAEVETQAQIAANGLGLGNVDVTVDKAVVKASKGKGELNSSKIKVSGKGTVEVDPS